MLIAGLIVFSYPFLAAAETSSDNAADLYIKCFQRFKTPDDAVGMQITNLPTATEKPSPEVVAFIEEQRKNFLITDIEAASKVKNCDWKLDYSKGFEMKVPYLNDTKQIVQLLRADGALSVMQGDCETAISRNLTIWRIGHHRGMGKTALEFLVSGALVSMSNEGLQETLGACVIDSTRLASLKKELSAESYSLPSLRDSILLEKKVMCLEFPKITYEKLVALEQIIVPIEEKEKARIRKFFKSDDPNSLAPAWIAPSIQYIENYYDSILAALDKPYPAAIAEMEQANEKANKDFDAGNDVAFLTTHFLPKSSLKKTYSRSTRIHTQGNALLAALDIYATVQQTGQLPKKLPNTSYVDCFSGKPFIYEITPNGFRLRCRQEDVTDKNKKTWEWEYTVKKP
jgi:hypothetical protein